MLIKRIEFFNYRIYHGLNIIELEKKSDKNIYIVSGRNGFGKTTFLMGLVWCMYGKQMQQVDDVYKKEIFDQGGYPKYLVSSLNRLAAIEQNYSFSVSITFTDIKIPEVVCNEIRITRSFNTKTDSTDELEILIDGAENELAKDIGHEYFIREFILPLEIAKFFFFDAEKIVYLAETSSVEQSRNLSNAYSEVLGIKKYEDIKKELESLQLKLRQDSASTEERVELENLIGLSKVFTIKIEAANNKINQLKEDKNEKALESKSYQEKLIKAGSIITLEELFELREKEKALDEKLTQLKDELKNSSELIPFAISGELLLTFFNQVDDEIRSKLAQFKNEKIAEKIDLILTELLNTPTPQNLVIDHKVFEHYSKTVEKLLHKHLAEEGENEKVVVTKVLHEYSESERNELAALLTYLKLSFRETFKRINGDYIQTKNELTSIRRKLRDAEANQEDANIAGYRDKKETIDKEIIRIENDIDRLNQEIGEFTNKKTNTEKQINELSRKIEVSEANKEKDSIITRNINNLKEFINQFKKQKKESLEKQILYGLETLMHKKGFITKVEVDIIGEENDIDIVLRNNRNEIIRKENLSKGEQQMYATALLSGLVEESDIDFPVFIDSPMQKFDEQHSENIVKFFYPNVSEQVVIFPLINKELTKNEFNMLYEHIAMTYLIDNINEDKSAFIMLEPETFFATYNSKYHADKH